MCLLLPPWRARLFGAMGNFKRYTVRVEQGASEFHFDEIARITYWQVPFPKEKRLSLFRRDYRSKQKTISLNKTISWQKPFLLKRLLSWSAPKLTRNIAYLVKLLKSLFLFPSKKYSSSLFLRELVLLIQELAIPLYNQNISGYPTARSLTDLRLPIDVHCIGI